jgi:hypothetical protein
MAAGFGPWWLFALPPPANERGSDDDDEDDEECQQELGHAGLRVFRASMLIEKAVQFWNAAKPRRPQSTILVAVTHR